MQLWPGWCQCRGAVYILIISFVLIIVYYVARISTGQEEDPLNRKVLDIPWLGGCCSWWPVLHFVMYAILGFYFPQCFLLLVIIGIAFEFFETGMGHVLQRCGVGDDVTLPPSPSPDVEYGRLWWYGSPKDVFFNIAGLLTGISLRWMYGNMMISLV